MLKSNEVIPQLDVPQLTLEQEYILRRALSASHKERFPSVRAFAEALMSSLTTQREQKVSSEAVLQQTPDRPPAEPAPEPIPRPQTEPKQEPTPSSPEPPAEPVVVPTVEPDIAQPIPDQTPFSPAPIPGESQPGQAPTPTREEDESVKEEEDAKEPVKKPESDKPSTAHLIITSQFSPAPLQVDLLREETTLGRAGSSDILLDQDTITSRHHALIKREGTHFVIYDQRSMYGVTVNDYKLPSETPYQLKDGDRIQIGDYTLFFSLGSSEHRQEATTEQTVS